MTISDEHDIKGIGLRTVVDLCNSQLRLDDKYAPQIKFVFVLPETPFNTMVQDQKIMQQKKKAYANLENQYFTKHLVQYKVIVSEIEIPKQN